MQLDLNNIHTYDELQSVLSQCFGFPVWYGRNWDAFWDCLRDRDLSRLPAHQRVTGMKSLSTILPRDAEILRECLEELALERPEMILELVP